MQQSVSAAQQHCVQSGVQGTPPPGGKCEGDRRKPGMGKVPHSPPRGGSHPPSASSHLKATLLPRPHGAQRRCPDGDSLGAVRRLPAGGPRSPAAAPRATGVRLAKLRTGKGRTASASTGRKRSDSKGDGEGPGRVLTSQFTHVSGLLVSRSWADSGDRRH